MREFKINKISKEEFTKLNEEDVMFITNPGRMGDEDGSTFIVKNGNEFTIYRVDGWMYPTKKVNISLYDIENKFPKWYELWKHSNDDNYDGKYEYIYMGFGNGLSVDKSIYDDFKKYLEKYLEGKEDNKYSIIYSSWKRAFIDYVEDKKYIIK